MSAANPAQTFLTPASVRHIPGEVRLVLEVHSEAAPPLPPPKDTPQKLLTFKDGAEARHTLLMLLVEADSEAPPQKTGRLGRR